MSETMWAMRLHETGRPLRRERVPRPVPGPGELLIRVEACAVCRTDLHVVDGELTEARLPLIPGHEIVGEVVALGPGVTTPAPGSRVGGPWLGWTCGECTECHAGRENLCAAAQFTGYTRDGGYAEYCVADARYGFPVTGEARASSPLLCAGLIGYRAWRLAGGESLRHLGLYGFGAAAHLLIQLARAKGQHCYAFTRPGDREAQAFARRLGARWAGDSGQAPPRPLDAAIIFAPVGELVPEALARVRPGGAVVCGGIHMSEIPAFPYRLLWEERLVRSVANLTRADGEAFLPLAARIPIQTETHAYPLADANRALDDLRAGRFSGAAVLIP